MSSLHRPCTALLFAPLLSLLAFAAQLHAQGWDNLTQQDLIERSQVVGVGRLHRYGPVEDGRQRAKIHFTKTLYSAIGEVKSIEVRVPIRTEPGVAQTWPDQKQGIWFVLQPSDKYAAINHPACWASDEKAKETANQAYALSQQAYRKAKKAVNEAKAKSGGDTGDNEESVAAYAAMTTAAAAGGTVAYQDQKQQADTYYQQALELMQTAGVNPPFPADLSDATAQNTFFARFKEILGPAGNLLGDLPAPGDPSRAAQLLNAQNAASYLMTELVRNTMGAKDPASALKNMNPLPLAPSGAAAPDQPVASPDKGKTPPGNTPFPPGPGKQPAPNAGQAPAFKLPDSALQNLPKDASRKQMLGSVTANLQQPAKRTQNPGPANQPGPRKGPGSGPGKGPGLK